MNRKRSNDYTILAMLIPFLLAVLFNLPGCYNNEVRVKSKNLHHCALGERCLFDGVQMNAKAIDSVLSPMYPNPLSTAYSFDSLHIMRPDFSEQQLDSAVYGERPMREINH